MNILFLYYLKMSAAFEAERLNQSCVINNSSILNINVKSKFLLREPRPEVLGQLGSDFYIQRNEEHRNSSSSGPPSRAVGTLFTLRARRWRPLTEDCRQISWWWLFWGGQW